MRRKKYSQEEVVKIFNSKGCILLSNYVDNNTPLEYICGCGKKAVSRLRAFKGYCRAC